MACIDAPHQGLVSPSVEIDAPHQSTFIPGEIDAPHQGLVSPSVEIDAPHQAGVRVYKQEFFDTYIQPEAETDPPDESGFSGGSGAPDTPGGTAGGTDSGATWPFAGTGESIPAEALEIPPVTHQLIAGGNDLSDYLVGWDWSNGRRTQGSGSMQLRAYNAKGEEEVPSRLGPEGGSLSALFHAHNMTAGNAITMTVTAKGRPYTYPTLLPGDPEWDDGLLTWNFTDLTPLLMVENQSRDDIVAEEGDLVTAHQEMKAIGAAYGVKVVCNFPDYHIRVFRMNEGSPKRWLDALAAPYRAVSRWEGSTLIYEALSFPGNPEYHLRDRFKIENMSYRENTANLRTSWQSFRLEPLPGQVGETRCVGNECVGRTVNVQFVTPTNSVFMVATAIQGKIVDGVFFDENDNPLNANPSHTYRGIKPAVRWEATYQANVTKAAYTPEYDVRAVGGASIMHPAFPIDDEFQAVLQSATLENWYGSRPEYRNLEDGKIPSAAVNNAMLAAIKLEMETGIVGARWGTPWFIPWIEPNHTLHITDFTYRQAKSAWLTSQVDHSFDGQEWSMEVGVTKPRAA